MEGKERQGQGELRTRQLLTVWEQERISDAAAVTCIERPASLARLPCLGPSPCSLAELPLCARVPEVLPA